MKYQEVIDFWFEEIEPKQIWIKDPAFDQLIIDRFSEVYEKATRCELFEWRESPEGCLAEIIVLDQFSRNIFRDEPGAFAQDALALALAQEAISTCADKDLLTEQKCFLFMPFMHSESELIHEEAMRLFNEPGLEENFRFEQHHREIILRFGRYPHRNAILGRESTQEELDFLNQPGSSF